MGASCIWTPGVNKDMSGEPSALHSDLVEYTGDRDLANVIWAATKVEGLIDDDSLEYDDNNEPTLESLNRAINIRSIVDKVSLTAEKRDVGAIDKNGKPISYNTLEDVIIATNDFNNENDDIVAYPVKRDGKYYINVEYKNEDNYQKPQEAKFNSELNNTIMGILRSLGFTAIEDNTIAGIFDPMNALETANGLKAVIRVAKGELGEEALPEEFCHLMIEGLQNHPLVSRVLSLLDNDDALRVALGEEYEDYKRKYTDNDIVDHDRLVKEAAGKLLERYIKTGELMDNPPAPKNLFQRIWSFIKGLFSKTSVDDINEVINDINRNTIQLASFVMKEEALPYFDRTKLFDAKPLYRLSTEVKSMEQIAEEGLKLASKRLKIVTARSKLGKYDKEQVRQIKNIQDLIEKKKYTSSCAAFLEDTLTQLRSIRNSLQSLDQRVEDSSLLQLRQIASVLRQVKEFSDGYSDIVNTIRRLPILAQEGKVEATPSDAKRLAELATEVSGIINNLMGNYVELRYRAVYEFLKTYWKDVDVKFGRDKGKTLTLAMILEYATKDINGVDRWINSMASASDPLLSLINKAVAVRHAKRDLELQSIIAEIRGIHKELKDAGYNTKFMYETDSEGKLTGNILSNINFEKFYKERRKYIAELKAQGLKYYEIKAKLEIWEASRTRVIMPNPNSIRTEVVPLAEPGEPYYIDRLSKLSKQQRDYYDRMLRAKILLDEKLPYRYTRTYNAVQIRNDMIEGIAGASNPVAAVKMILGNATDNFVRRVDNTEFGEQVEGDETFGRLHEVSLDFSGNPIQKLPVYYTRRLEDMSRLSTDFTGSLIAYAGMAIDYSEMNKIVDILEITRDLVHDRDVQQLSGDAKMMETFKILHKDYSENYVKKGGKIAERLDDFMDSVVYKRSKKEEGKITIKGKEKEDENGEKTRKDTEIDVAKSLDTFKSYTGILGLGLNMFSGMSNVVMGKMQIFIEALAGEYFGYKNALHGKINYYKLMPAYLGEINSTSKTNKLALLVDKYDALEEFYSNLRQQGKFKGPLSRLMQNTSFYILNNLGEHYLHCRTMLAILDRQKVKKGNDTITLFDAWKVVEKQNDEGVKYYELLLEDGVTDMKGNPLYTESLDKEYDKLLSIGAKNRTEEQNERLALIESIKENTDNYTIDLRMKIGRVNQSLNGAFNEPDKGAIHRMALGRMAMQFRQWMPEHYNRRFASAYYDTQLEQMREGFYRSAGRFTWELMKDARELKFQWATRWKHLSNEERRNCRRAATEACMFGTLCILCSAMAGWKDKNKKIRWKMFIWYNLLRAKLESGASFPLSTDFFKNIVTLLQSPAAAVKSLDRFTGLLEFWNIFHEIKSGRYKGWSEYERNLVKAVPLYSQFLKFMDLGKDNYMFNYF